jgi:hypothetical protein
MIVITNISKKARRTGSHLYQIRINEKIITQFRHNREDSLDVLFEKAALAIKKYDNNLLIEMSKIFNDQL